MFYVLSNPFYVWNRSTKAHGSHLIDLNFRFEGKSVSFYWIDCWHVDRWRENECIACYSNHRHRSFELHLKSFEYINVYIVEFDNWVYQVGKSSIFMCHAWRRCAGRWTDGRFGARYCLHLLHSRPIGVCAFGCVCLMPFNKIYWIYSLNLSNNTIKCKYLHRVALCHHNNVERILGMCSCS